LKLTAGRALGQTRVPALIQRTLEFVLSSEVRSQDVSGLVSGVGANEAAGEIFWAWMQDQWSVLYGRFGENTSSLGRILGHVFHQFQSEADLAKVEAFFSKKDISLVSMAYKQAVEGIKVRSNWIQRDLRDVQSWLNHLIILLPESKPESMQQTKKTRCVNTRAMSNYFVMCICLLLCFKLLSYGLFCQIPKLAELLSFFN